MPHVVLLGDSIFDNAAYVAGGPDVVTHLRGLLPKGWKATLAAVDGAVVSGLKRQLGNIPGDATHLVLSVGGNDALGHVDILDRRASSFGEVLDHLARIGSAFADAYVRMLDDVLALGLPVTVCTIYNGALPDAALQRRAAVALTVFNDAIVQSALASFLPIIELRQVCSDPGDYANPIEPSVQGGAKIARAILGTLSARPEAAD